ncbi:MAG TPA: neutral zinc metallopeptidase [Burkholderiales bacterium]|nr:neutral zinc metallopeptidase [Burkholderiales bacterium]
MRLEDQQRSENIEDRRGMRIPGGRTLAGGGIGIVVIALIAMFFGIDPGVVMQGMQEATVATAPQQQVEKKAPSREDQMADFIAAVLGSTEDTWTEIFARGRKKYQKPVLVLFSGAVQSACGFAQAAVGPFYCPADSKLYIDLAFYRDLQDKFRAPGDFAQAYVLAHEVGHHVQNLLGIAEQVRRAQQRAGERQANTLQVRMELQADCFAGIWAASANRNKRILEPGDVEEGLRAAAAVGDDRIQMASRGYVSPESFTHGSSEQRMRWFRRGLETGDLKACDTFAAQQL